MTIAIELVILWFLSNITTAVWEWYAKRQVWLDIPNNRSSHKTPTPRGGGIGFVTAFSIFIAWYLVTNRYELLDIYMYFGAVALAVLGFFDDRFSLSSKFRLIAQVGVIVFIWPFLNELPPIQIWGGIVISGLSLPLLLSLALLWLINLFNFMDGTDALAATETIFIAGAVSLLTGIQQEMAILPLVLLVAVLGFLPFNLPKASVFMGDVGSYFLGFTLPILGLISIKIGALNYWVVIILFGTFVADSTTTLLGRLHTGGLWYHPHRTHAYQLAAKRYQSHGCVAWLNAAINVFWLLPLAALALKFPEYGALLLVLAWSPLVALVWWVRANFSSETKDDNS